MGQKYAVVELNQHPQGNNVQDILSDMTGARTVRNRKYYVAYPIRVFGPIPYLVLGTACVH